MSSYFSNFLPQSGQYGHLKSPCVGEQFIQNIFLHPGQIKPCGFPNPPTWALHTEQNPRATFFPLYILV
jgi:hypothetical protein